MVANRGKGSRPTVVGEDSVIRGLIAFWERSGCGLEAARNDKNASPGIRRLCSLISHIARALN
jgi:hypothetical protein